MTPHCDRCQGVLLRSRDEYGDRDDHCVSCGHRPSTKTREELAALAAEQERKPGQMRRRNPSVGGFYL